jgi:carbamate kinase
MAPKIQAVINYLDAGGQQAIITSPEHIGPALEGKAGTHITPG